MKSLLVSLASIAATASLVLAACGQATPAPAPTTAPSKPAEPTKAAAPAAPTQASAAHTAAPAPKVDFPQKGKSITIIVTAAAGGSTDVQARLLAPGMEKELGVPVQIVNKAAAAHQEGLTALVQSKPDGYTLVSTNLPSAPLTYLNEDRKAIYGRKDLVQVANVVSDPEGIAVPKNSPWKTLKDVIDAAKAKPGELRIATSGLGNDTHLALMLFEQATGTKFQAVHFNGAAPAMTAFVGGHVDLAVQTVGSVAPQIRTGDARYLAVMDTEKSPYVPDAPTMASQGINITLASDRGYSVPGGAPKEVVAILEQSIKKAFADAAFKKSMDDAMLAQRWMDAAQYTAYWDQYETKIKPLVALIPKQ